MKKVALIILLAVFLGACNNREQSLITVRPFEVVCILRSNDHNFQIKGNVIRENFHYFEVVDTHGDSTITRRINCFKLY